MSYVYNRTAQKDIRRKLRKDEPATERRLWSKLRNRQQLGFKFRRQYSIGNYVVDFCCPEAKLAVEIDGDSHYQGSTAIDYDGERQKFIEGFGFRVIRFTNKDIMDNILGVLEIIAAKLKQ